MRIGRRSVVEGFVGQNNFILNSAEANTVHGV